MYYNVQSGRGGCIGGGGELFGLVYTVRVVDECQLLLSNTPDYRWTDVTLHGVQIGIC